LSTRSACRGRVGFFGFWKLRGPTSVG
jgi:hypothetical protein